MTGIDLEKTFRLIWNRILATDKITIVTHIDPDGDTIGSAVALKAIILANTKGKIVKIVGQKPPRFLTFLDEAELVSDDFFNDSLVIVVDTSTVSRFSDKRVRTSESIKIDHHHHEEDWLLEIGGDHWPATGELIYELATMLNLQLTKRALIAIFVAIWTDTDGMLHRNISPRTEEIMTLLLPVKAPVIEQMALNQDEERHIKELASQLQVQGQVTHLISESVVPNDYSRQLVAELLKCTKTEILFCAVPDQDGIMRVSFRSKGNVDVSGLAKMFGGGGHFSSSGARAKSLSKAEQILQAVLNIVNN